MAQTQERPVPTNTPTAEVARDQELGHEGIGRRARPEQQSMRSTLTTQRLVMVVAGIMLGMLLASLDQTIVGTAMPRIIADLHGLEHYAWVFTAYMLASTVTVPLYGKLSDIYGRRIFFLGAMVLFLAGSALAGTSQDMAQLIIWRALQGVGAGGLMPIAIAVIGDIFPPAERGKWQGLFSAVFGLSSIVGPTLGGWITDGWGWRWVFYVNMPVGAIALLVAGFALPRHSRHTEHKIDYWGALALVAGAVPLLLAFSWAGSQYEWGSWQIIGLLVFSVIMTGVFLWIEMHAAEPVISPGLFKNDIFTISVIGTFLVSAGMFGAILYLPMFVQGVSGKSASNSGEILTPMMLGFVVSSIIGGQIISRTHRYKILALVGLAVATIGMFLFSQMNVATNDFEVIRNMVITGLGMGVMMALPTIVVQNAFPFSLLGQVTASLTFFRSIGSTIGVAVLGTIMTNSFTGAFQNNLPATLKAIIPPTQLSQLQNPQVLVAPEAAAAIQQKFHAFGAQGDALYKQFHDAVQLSLADAISHVFFIGFIIIALALVTWAFIREIPLRKSNTVEAQSTVSQLAPE